MDAAFDVMIDQTPNRLTYVGKRGTDFYCYNTNNNAACHTFPFLLSPGMSFRTNGHHYVIVARVR